jgi:hypothetical protein
MRRAVPARRGVESRRPGEAVKRKRGVEGGKTTKEETTTNEKKRKGMGNKREKVARKMKAKQRETPKYIPMGSLEPGSPPKLNCPSPDPWDRTHS